MYLAFKERKNMKKINKILITAAMIASIAFTGLSGTMAASATSVGDVIAYARSIGMPESEIQGYVAKYGGRDYTSEQCDKAIAALAGMKDKYKNNQAATSQSSQQEKSTEAKTETQTEKSTKSDANKAFFNKSSEDKIKDINGMSESEGKNFWNSLSDEEKNELKSVVGEENLKDFDSLKAAAKSAAEDLGIGETSKSETTEEVSETEAETESETTVVVTTSGNDSYKSVVIIAGLAIIIVILIFLIIGKKGSTNKKSSKKKRRK